MKDIDKKEISNAFFKRADNHIELANEHLRRDVSATDASSSLMFASARFNAWVAANEFKNAEEFMKGKEEVLKYFVNEYREMLENNLQNYADNFNLYIHGEEPTQKEETKK